MLTKAMVGERETSSLQLRFSLPVALMIVGILLIGASFLPIGKVVAEAQWTTEDSAAYDRVSREYKFSTFDTHVQHGVSEQEWQSQRDRMKQRMRAYEEKLERAKSQPQLWSRYLMGIGVLVTAAGFYVSKNSAS